MEIALYIETDDPGVVAFDSHKVMDRIKAAFPSFTTDGRDMYQEDFDRAMEFLSKRNLPEEQLRRMESELRGKVQRNGPGYKFEIDGPDGSRIQGRVSRLRTSFRSEIPWDAAFEDRLIRFLRAFQVGLLLCDTQTAAFSVPSEFYADSWELAPRLRTTP